MTDERIGDALWPALRRLPPGSGVVLRHHDTSPAERAAIARRVRRIARARRLVLVVEGERPGRLRTARAHDRREALAGVRAKADALFDSPVHPTRSHPGQPSLGVLGAVRIARGLPTAVIALGGLDARTFRRLRVWSFHGWAGIDAWMR